MDQQPENLSSVDQAPCATESGGAAEKATARRREGAGEHAIERIAAAARALADNERSLERSAERSANAGMSKAEKGKDRPATALIPASAVFAKEAAAKTSAWMRMPSHLPFYAAALCLALGVGGVLGGHLAQTGENKETLAEAETAKIERALPWKGEVALAQNQQNHATAKVRDDLKALRGEISALRANNEQLRQAEGQRQTQELRALRAALEAQKAETASLKADLAARFDRADRDAAQRSEKTAERVERIEKRMIDPNATGSIAKPGSSQAKADIKPEQKPDRPPVHGMVLREVGRGVALIETRRGLLEVMPGDPIPGAGRVETIEKHAGKWRVVTTTGIIDDRLD